MFTGIGGTIFKSIGGVFMAILDLLKWPAIVIGAIIAIICLIYTGCGIYYYCKGFRPTGTEHYKPAKEGILKVLWHGIKQAAYDRQTRNVEHIPEQWTGLFCIEGMPGTGKSTSAVQDAIMKRTEYPKLKTYSNMDITFQDGEIAKWQDLMTYNNEEYGQLYLLDEMATLLNSRSYKDFPPEALDLITQSRKVRTRILFTTQDFRMIDVNLRRLTRQIWRPITFMKTICIVLKYRPTVNSEGELEKKKLVGIDYYRQTPELRECFDTRKQIAVLKREGFAARSEQIRPGETKKKTETTLTIKQKK